MRSEFDDLAPPSSPEALTVLENDVRFGVVSRHMRAPPMSALPPIATAKIVCFGSKADICGAIGQVHFTPKKRTFVHRRRYALAAARQALSPFLLPGNISGGE